MAASNPFQRELCAVAFLGVGVFLGVSLATYSPSDPVSDSLGPFSALYRPDQVEYPAVEEISNSCGRWGALAADLLLTGVGAGAYYTVGSILVLSGFLFLRAGLEGPLFRFAGWLGSLVGVSSLAALLFPEWSPGPMVGSGGYLGALGAGLLLHHFAMFGSLLLAGSFVVGGLLMCSDQIFPSILRWTLGGFLAPLFRRREPVAARVDAGRPQRTPNKSPPVKIAPTKSKREKAAAAAAVAAEGIATVGRGGLANGSAGPRTNDDSSPSILPIRGRGKAGASAVAEDGELSDDDDDSFANESTESSARAARSGSRNLGLAGAAPKPASLSAAGRGRGVNSSQPNKSGKPDAVVANRNAIRAADHNASSDSDSEPDPEDSVEAAEAASSAGGTAAQGPHFKSRSTRDARSAMLAELQEDGRDTAVDDYELPGIDLLVAGEDIDWESQEKEVRRKAKVLEKTFADFGFQVRVVEIETGPVIAQYEVELEAGLRLSKITALADDLAIALRVPSVRIVAPIPGKNTVGIEVPNEERQVVRLREVIEETNGKIKKMRIPLFLGKDVSGNPLAVDLSTLPHLLIAGRTGTGKSVCLNAIISSILMTRRPDEVRMIMIDPKMVELSGYGRLPHLMHPVVTDMKKAEAILAWGVEKMEERYALLARAGVRHISNYNQLGEDELRHRLQPEDDDAWASIPKQLPFIVIVADEIADMMMTAGKEVEQHIIRLAQKSRAVGIHLILATQKPTVDVITGLIKSNLPARISFQVASRVDSRVVLDEMGADKLLGNGDMLFLWPGTSTLLRGQGTYLGDDEITRLVDCCSRGRQQNFVSELVNMKVESEDQNDGGLMEKLRKRDELYESAVDVVIREGRGSCSLLQRALGIGYGRAARLIDFMAEDGIVGTYAGSQAREVLMTVEQWEQLQNEPSSGPLVSSPVVNSLSGHATSGPALAATGTTGPASASRGNAAPPLVGASGRAAPTSKSAVTAVRAPVVMGTAAAAMSGVAFAPPSALDEFFPEALASHNTGNLGIGDTGVANHGMGDPLLGAAPVFAAEAGVPPRMPLAGNLPPSVALNGLRATDEDDDGEYDRDMIEMEDGPRIDDALDDECETQAVAHPASIRVGSDSPAAAFSSSRPAANPSASSSMTAAIPAASSAASEITTTTPAAATTLAAATQSAATLSAATQSAATQSAATHSAAPLPATAAVSAAANGESRTRPTSSRRGVITFPRLVNPDSMDDDASDGQPTPGN